MNELRTDGLSFPLRSGESCAIQGEALVIGQRHIPLRDIISTGLVADTSVAVPPGWPPAPGVALHMRDGAIVAFTPVEQLDCWRLLQALADARPELAAPLPPPPGSSYGHGYGYNPGYGPSYGYGYNYGYNPGYGMAVPTESEKTLAGICHLSVFFAPLILPLIIWLAMGKTQPYASQQAKQAFWFHLAMVGLSFIAFMGMEAYLFTTLMSSANISAPAAPASLDPGFYVAMLVGYGMIGVAGLINAVFSAIASVRAFQGKPYHYPLLGWLRP